MSACRSVLGERFAIHPHVGVLERERGFRNPAHPSRKDHMTSKKQRGFSLLEMLVTVSIGLIIGGMTFITMMPLLNKSHIDSAYDTTLMVLRNTRHLAVTQGHEYIVTFNAGAKTITAQYQPPPTG